MEACPVRAILVTAPLTLWIGGLDRRRDPTLLRADSRTLVVLRAISLL